jgi:hypothetical protein
VPHEREADVAARGIGKTTYGNAPKKRKSAAKGKSKAHPGFKAVQAQIAAKEGISPDRAGAILAAGTRRASAAAKKANPRLTRVKGKAKK